MKHFHASAIRLSSGLKNLHGAALFSFLMTLCSHMASAQWSQVGDTMSGDCYSFYARMAIAPDGTPYIAYRDRDWHCVVKKYNGNSWEQVGQLTLGAKPTDIAFAINKNGTPYLATDTNDYTNRVSRTIVFKCDGSSWVAVGNASAFADDYINTSTFSSVFDATNSPCVGHYSAVIRFNGTTWEPISGSSLQTNQLLATSAGRIFMSTGVGAIYQYRSDTTWDLLTKTGLDSINSEGMLLSVAPNGSLYALFYGIYNHWYRRRLYRFENNGWTQLGRSFPPFTGIGYVAFNRLLAKVG